MIDGLNVLWATTVPNSWVFQTRPLLINQNIIIRQGKNVLSVNSINGHINWVLELEKQGGDGRFLFAFEDMVFTEFSHGSQFQMSGILAIEQKTGKEIWRLPMNTIITDEQITICNKQIYVIDHSQNKNRFIHIIDSVNGKKIEQIGIPFSSSINILFLREALILSHCFPTSEDPGLYAYFPQDEKIQILKQGYTVKNISNGDCLFTQSKKNDLSLCEIAVFDNKLKQNWLIEQMGLAFEVDNDFLYTNSINNILTPRINVFDIKTKTLTRSVDIPLKKIETLKASNGLLLVYGDYTRLLLDVYQGRIISPLIELTTIVAPPYFVKESRTAYMVVKDTRQKINTLYAYSI